MADELEKPSFGNFSIETSMGMGTGNAELLNDLLSPETSTSLPEDIQKLETEKPKKVVKQEEIKKIVPTEKESTEKEKPAKTLAEELYENAEEEEEEEEEEFGKKSIKKPTEENSEEVEEDNNFTALAKDLVKLGVFSAEDEEEEINIKTPEEFLERFNIEKKKGAIETLDNFIGQFGEDYQNAFQAIFVKGADPKEYFNTFNSIQNFAEMDLTQESNQIAVVKQMLTDQGLEPEDVESELESIKNYGDLENKSQKYHKVLIKKEAVKLQSLEQESSRKLQAQQAAKQQYQNNVQNVLTEKVKTKEFDGIPINPKLAGELQDFLLVEKWKTPSGETLSDFDKAILDLKKPENHAQKVKVALLIKLLEKDPTLSTIQKAGISKKSDSLFNEMAKQTSKGFVKSSGKSNSNTFLGL